MDPNSKDLTLKQYVDMRLAALQRELELRMDASEASDRKTNVSLDYRLEEVKSFRDSVKSQMSSMVTRRELEAMREAQTARIDGLTKQLYIIVGSLATFQILFQIWVNSQ